MDNNMPPLYLDRNSESDMTDVTPRSSTSTIFGYYYTEDDQDTSDLLHPGAKASLCKSGHTSVKKSFLIASLALLLILTSVSSYLLGHYHAAKSITELEVPRLSTHDITAAASRQHLQVLDDEFFTQDPSNLKYIGRPRPELDAAWNSLLQDMNIRIRPSEAVSSGFSSVTLQDGTGDLYALPAVFHNLHCLYSIRKGFFPNVYVDDHKDILPPGPNEINKHLDHCIEILRQAIMCHGDLSLYNFTWPQEKGRVVAFPRHVGHREHVCKRWDGIAAWARERSFSAVRDWRRLLKNPYFEVGEEEWESLGERKGNNYSIYD